MVNLLFVQELKQIDVHLVHHNIIKKMLNKITFYHRKCLIIIIIIKEFQAFILLNKDLWQVKIIHLRLIGIKNLWLFMNLLREWSFRRHKMENITEIKCNKISNHQCAQMLWVVIPGLSISRLMFPLRIQGLKVLWKLVNIMLGFQILRRKFSKMEFRGSKVLIFWGISKNKVRLLCLKQLTCKTGQKCLILNGINRPSSQYRRVKVRNIKSWTLINWPN